MIHASSFNASQSVARQITDLVLHRLARGEELRVLGLTGPPGTGKSTVAGIVSDLLQSADVEVAGILPMDGFHLSNTVLDLWERHDRKGAPDTFDIGGYVSLLHRVRTVSNETLLAPDYRRDLHEPIAASIPLAPTGIIITEGNYLGVNLPGWRDVRELIDMLVYIDTPRSDMLRRLVARHEAFGRDRVDAAHWVRTVDAANIEFVEESRPRADYVVSAEEPPEG
ncbi:phosphoribulokinase [Schaalia sp. ZJ405]|uniref:phosphoribulokinase n=1 Tax=Schaalia sp. ZJ405 TaxID=2709403 RepID=UPI0013EDB5A8|nr:phosphoribulokinase [Schaalia sp. ZJ405]QPK81453.1 phosphoribulokinase [Schaalia sp. ZJ405]